MLRDLRNLPTPVIERLTEAGALDGIGVRVGRFLVEGGTAGRAAAPAHRLEVREAESSQPVLDGYATTYDQAYEVMGGKTSMWGWDETIVAGACAKSVAERDDVYWLFDHAGLPVASTKARTLELDSDKVGLLSIARPDMRSAWNNEVVMRIQGRDGQPGDIDQMSFAFQVVRQEWNADYTERFITELKLFDVSGVKYPANPTTHVHARQTGAPALAPVTPLDVALRQADALRLRRIA